MIKNFASEDWCKVVVSKPTNGLDYYVSNYGRIKSVDEKRGTERILSGSMSTGSLAVTTRLKGGGTQAIYIHRHIAELFVRRPSPQHIFVNHKDGNKRNNHYQNLEWVTQEELTRIQKERGVFASNRRKNPNTKLNQTKANLIRERAKSGKVKKTTLARQFGVSVRTIERIMDGSRWANNSE